MLVGVCKVNTCGTPLVHAWQAKFVKFSEETSSTCARGIVWVWFPGLTEEINGSDKLQNKASYLMPLSVSTK
jgi:hypothetical protein